MDYKIVEKPIKIRNSAKVVEYTKFLKILTELQENQAAKQTFQNRKSAVNKASQIRQFEKRRGVLKFLGFQLHVTFQQRGNQFDLYYFATKKTV